MPQYTTMEPTRPQAALRVLHRKVDERATSLASRHGQRLQCKRGCASCCVDDLTVLRVEAERIREAHPELLRSGVPHAAGACAFLDENDTCRVYEDRPYVCRTQGLPLRWLSETEAGDIIEQRDICPLNLEGPPLLTLGESECWLLGPTEGELCEIGEQFEAREPTRIELRGLFRATPAR